MFYSLAKPNWCLLLPPKRAFLCRHEDERGEFYLCALPLCSFKTARLWEFNDILPPLSRKAISRTPIKKLSLYEDLRDCLRHFQTKEHMPSVHFISQEYSTRLKVSKGEKLFIIHSNMNHFDPLLAMHLRTLSVGTVGRSEVNECMHLRSVVNYVQTIY